MINKDFFKHIIRELNTSLFHYLLLITVGIFFLLILSVLKGYPMRQYLVLSLFVFFYIIWGVIHHLFEKTLRLKIVLEYILIGAIALFLLQLLLIR